MGPVPTTPNERRPGGPTSPQPFDWYYKVQAWEADQTARLMGLYQAARIELETFIRDGDLTASDSAFYRKLLDETNRVGSTLNAQGAQWVSNVIPSAVSQGFRTHSSVVVPERAVEALSRNTLGLIVGANDDFRQRIRAAIGAGILTGLPNREIRNRIIMSGIRNIPRWPSIEYRAGVIARTETMRAYNEGALDGIKANGAMFAEWIASPDEAACPICGPRDGKIFRLVTNPDLDVDPYPSAPILPPIPAHPRCRCTTRAVYRDADGKVIDPTAAPKLPTLPPDEPAASFPPEIPPASGDIRKAAAALKGKDVLGGSSLARIDDALLSEGGRQAKAAYLAKEQFWRNANIAGLDVAKFTKGQYEAFMKLRYGVDILYRRMTYAKIGPRYRTGVVNALETYHGKAGFRWGDSDALREIRFMDRLEGLPNPGQYLPLAARIEFALTQYTYTIGQPYRIGDRDYFESSAIHELGHALDAHRRAGGPSALSDVLFGRGSREADAFQKLHFATTGDATRAHAERDLAARRREQEEVVRRIAYRQEEIARLSPGDPYAPISQRGVERDQELLKAIELSISRLEDILNTPRGTDVHLNDYAAKNEFEDFADSAAMFLLDPAKLKLLSPRRYEFLAQTFGVPVE